MPTGPTPSWSGARRCHSSTLRWPASLLSRYRYACLWRTFRFLASSRSSLRIAFALPSPSTARTVCAHCSLLVSAQPPVLLLSYIAPIPWIPLRLGDRLPLPPAPRTSCQWPSPSGPCLPVCPGPGPVVHPSCFVGICHVPPASSCPRTHTLAPLAAATSAASSIQLCALFCQWPLRSGSCPMPPSPSLHPLPFAPPPTSAPRLACS